MSDTKKKDEGSPQSQYSEIPELGVENGTDNTLSFVTAFNPIQLGLKKSTSESLSEVLRDDEYSEDRPTVRQLATMRRLDGHARALYRLLTLPIRAALNTATFVPADGGEKEAEFIDLVFRTAPANGGMTQTFQKFMGHLLTGLFDGFAAFEKVFWVPEFGPLEGKYTLKKLAHRPSETITFLMDSNGGFGGLRQRTHLGGKTVDAFIDPEYAFYYAAQEEERKFYGVSFFESAFPHYDAKAKAYFTAHLAAQRAAVGTRVGTVPSNASAGAKREFAHNLSNLSLAQWMMLPDGFGVDVLREGGSYDFLGLINHHNHMMSESVLANFFDKDTGGGSGESGALVNFAQPGDDMFILMLRAVMDDIANSINHYIIPQLIDYNFDGAKYPTFTWGTFTDEQRQAIASTFDKLATAGQSVNVVPEFMRELQKIMAEEMGIVIDWDAVDAREAEEKAAQAAMDMGMAAGGEGGAPGAAGGLPGSPGGALPVGGDPQLGAAAAAGSSITDEDLESAEDLTDVLRIMAKRADEVAATTPAVPVGEEEEPEEDPVKLSGLSDDILNWASQMLVMAGEDWSDG